MTAVDCGAPLCFDRLVDYTAGELAPEVEEHLEAHYFGCSRCSRRLALVEGLGAAVSALVRRGAARASVTRDVALRIEREGLALRRCALTPGDVFSCTVAPNDDFVLVELLGRAQASAGIGAGGRPSRWRHRCLRAAPSRTTRCSRRSIPRAGRSRCCSLPKRCGLSRVPGGRCVSASTARPRRPLTCWTIRPGQSPRVASQRPTEARSSCPPGRVAVVEGVDSRPPPPATSAESTNCPVDPTVRMDLLAQETAINHGVEDLLDQRQRAPEVTTDHIAQPRAPKHGAGDRRATHASEHHLHRLEIDAFWITDLHPLKHASCEPPRLSGIRQR